MLKFVGNYVRTFSDENQTHKIVQMLEQCDATVECTRKLNNLIHHLIIVIRELSQEILAHLIRV